jgi:glycosyltransferase involved in cell wall biosynthesis
MRIVIDLQCLQNGSRHRGIGRYMLNLSKQIIQQADGDEIHLTLNASMSDSIESVRDDFDSLLPQEHISVFQPLNSAQFHSPDNDARRIVSETLRERFLLSLEPDAVLVGSMVEGFGDEVVTSIGRLHRAIPTSAILYDLIPLTYPEKYLADERVHAWYWEKIEYLKRADLLLSISESSRNEGLLHKLQPPEGIVNISTGADPSFTQIEPTNGDLLRSRFSITGPYLLYTGASDPRKNLPRLIESFARLPRAILASHQLVLGGGMPADHTNALREAASAHGLSPDKIVFTGHISDSDMVGLYRGAKAFVFPSYHEGFGLPVLEAMQFETPCVASNRSSVPEVVGMPEALFDPFSVDSITQALTKALTDDEFRTRFAAHCPLQVAKFTWEASARRALDALRSTFKPLNNKANQHARQGAEPDVAGLCQQIAQVSAGGRAQLCNPDALREMAVSVDRSLPRGDRAKHLFVDVTALHHHGLNTGIQRVVRNVLKELPPIAGPQWQVVPVYCSAKADYRVSEKVASSVLGQHMSDDGCCIDPRPGDIFLGLDLNDVDVARNASYFAWLRTIGVSVYFIVYDLLPWLLPDYFSSEVCANYSRWLKVASASDGLVGISRTVADELLDVQKYMGTRRRRSLKIGWFHLGADFKPSMSPTGDIRSEMSSLAGKRFFLVVATIEPRKGHAQVLEAFEKLWSEGSDVHLVFAGKQGWMVEELVQRLCDLQQTEPRFHWFQDLTDVELEHAYLHAAGVIAASMGEGYGLPIVEALHYGCRVIARDIPVFREIAQEHAVYFGGTSRQSLADAVMGLARNPSAPGVRPAGSPQTVRWKQSTQQLWDNIGEGRWYDAWMPSRDWKPLLQLSLQAVDQQFGTQIGKIGTAPDKQPLIVSGGEQAGFLLHGPYVHIPPGRFTVSAAGTLETDGNGLDESFFDVVANNGTKILIKGALANRQPRYLFSAEFETQESYTDVETRIHVGQGLKASVSRISLLQLPTTNNNGQQ